MKSKTKRAKRITSNRRIDVAPEGGIIAKLGFYCSPVQKVVRKWKGKIPKDLLENYFSQIGRCVIHGESAITNPFPHLWPMIWEFGAALSKVVKTESPAKWLLKLPLDVEENGRLDKWDAVAATIKKAGGQLYSGATLNQMAKRMKLLTPAKAANSYRTAKGAQK